MEPAGVGGGGSGSGIPRSQFGISPSLTVDAITDSQQVEAASPISSRPPASSSLNYDELIRLSSSAQIDDAIVGDDTDRSGAAAAGNRWPRQETLALLKIRSDMDSTFRDATLKGPLWDEVSRKLAELGYTRNAKKCKEKFENVQKYYKRTKEGRGGRQDGKTYKFFTELEALHSAAATTTTPTTAVAVTVAPSFSTPPTGFGISNPTPISSVKISPTTAVSSHTPMGMFSSGEHFTARPLPPPVAVSMGVSFSSNTSSASTEDDAEMAFGVEVEGEPSRAGAGSSRKRRRRTVVKGSGSRTSHKMMMDFFEGLMKQVMHKQEVMQQKFLEAIEKREQDRMIREEALKIQEMARLSREQERIAQERIISASRDAAIIDFLQKFTGQTIQFDVPVPEPGLMPAPAAVHMPVATSVPMSVPVPLSPVPPLPLQHQIKKTTHVIENEIPLEMSQLGGDEGMSSEPISSSRWPKPEVLALIKLRGGLESKYQEMGPKGPLWEEISAGMQHMGYNRNAKRCKEKWENINKYYKKVKESNKKRREDSKTCPYFNELDALYRNKILGGGGGGGGGSTSRSSSDTGKFEQDPIKNMDMEMTPIPTHSSSINPQPQSETIGLSASLFGEETEEQPATSTKPEDIVNELMELQDPYHQPGSNNVDRNEDDDDGEDEEDYYSTEDDDDDDDTPEDQKRINNNNKMDYKIEFQRQKNAGNSNGVKSEFQSMAVVQ